MKSFGFTAEAVYEIARAQLERNARR